MKPPKISELKKITIETTLKRIKSKGVKNSNEDNCQHEYRTFIDRVDKSKEVWCIKCGKIYPGAYSKYI